MSNGSAERERGKRKREQKGQSSSLPLAFGETIFVFAPSRADKTEHP